MAKVIIICDFNKDSGFGHLTRMKSLAKTFERNSNQVTFIFEKKYKNFNSKYLIGYNNEYLNFSLTKYSYKILKYLKENSIDIIIFDSYYINHSLKKELYKNFFLVSIDDKIQKHKSHLIFNSREGLNAKSLSTKDCIWKTGRKFLLFGKTKRKNKTSNQIKKILVHAGGSSAFNHFKILLIETINFFKKKKVQLYLLCKDNQTKLQIDKYIKRKISSFDKIFYIYNNKDFSKNINKFDIIVGPSGITTYETLASNVLPLSFPIFNDGRDNIYNWNLMGNIFHLNKFEINNKKIINEVWKFIFNNYSLVLKNLKNKSKKVKNNSINVFKEIIQTYQKPKKNFLIKNLEEFDYKVKSAKFDQIRLFLQSRNNLSVRKVSSNPNHIISFSEHLNWWINRNIKKFVIFNYENKPVAYHWIKLTKTANKKNIITSGWFPDQNDENTLKSANIIVKHQKKFIKKNYKGSIWIININKKNLFSLKLNHTIGFKKAQKTTEKTAQEIFKINLTNFDILEMKV